MEKTGAPINSRVPNDAWIGQNMLTGLLYIAADSANVVDIEGDVGKLPPESERQDVQWQCGKLVVVSEPYGGPPTGALVTRHISSKKR